MKKSSLRDNILRTASNLFYRQGYSNTGINQIIEEAGIAKSTLYQQFRSKEDLLIEYLDETGATTMDALRQAAAGQAQPKDQLIAIFDYLAGLVIQETYYGCHFLNIVYEMPGDEARIRARIKKQKDEVRALFAEILAPSGQQLMADEIYTLFEGALVGVKIHQDIWPIEAAKSGIEKLVK